MFCTISKGYYKSRNINIFKVMVLHFILIKFVKNLDVLLNFHQ